MENNKQPEDPKPKSPLELEELYEAFRTADNIVLKKYVGELSKAHCIGMSHELKSIPVGSNVLLYRITQITYDKNENIQDKLTTVYSTIFSLRNCSLVMLINGDIDKVELYLGVVTKEIRIEEENGEKKVSCVQQKVEDNGKTLKSAFKGNFPGSVLEGITIDKVGDSKSGKELIDTLLKKADYISSVSSIPAVRNGKEREHKNHEFVQGLEKLIDAMRGQKYSAVIIADAMSNHRIEEMCAEYEDIYSQLVPFKGSSQTINAQMTDTDTKSIIKGITDTMTETLSKSLTHGTSTAKTHTDSFGGGFGVSVGSKKIAKVNVTANYNHAYARMRGENKSSTETESTGTSKSLTEQNSVARSLSQTKGESIQLNYENRAVKTLLDRIDEQIKRMRSCEDFGMFDTCAYFAADKYDIVAAAAATFMSVTRGENSSSEASAVNIWKDEEDIACIKDYLMRFYHPEFCSIIDEKNEEAEWYLPTTPAMLVSGREMAYQMVLPHKSIPGVPITECTEFGRETVLLSGEKEDTPLISLGNIFHMHQEDENAKVKLNINNMTAHTFITGSTGAGKSTTVYKLLDELIKVTSDGTKEKIKFLVIEPAKGEYKNALAENRGFDVKVYGTNSNITKLLRINPFSFPSAKIHIYEHLDRLTEIFNVCWPMYAAMPAVLKAAMENAYISAGWDLVRSKNEFGNIFPSFKDVADEVRKYVERSEYSDENKSNYKGSLLTRLESLTNGINSMIFSGNELENRELFDENVIVDLSRIGSVETKALIMGILILKLQEYRMAFAEGSNSALRHITVLEEAHNLLKRTSTEQSSETANLLGKSVEMLANSIAEMRTYGEGFIIADQSPGLLDLSVIRNTNTKIIMRLPDFSDRELVGKAAGLNDDQIIELAKLPRGVAAVYQNDWVESVLCAVKKPELIECNFLDPDVWPVDSDQSILFDLINYEQILKLDNVREADDFQQAFLKSSFPTSIKVELLRCLRDKEIEKYFRVLAPLLFDYFENSEEIMKNVEGTMRNVSKMESRESMKERIITMLKPARMGECGEHLTFNALNKSSDILILLLIDEYCRRRNEESGIWNELEKWKEFEANVIKESIK